MKKYLKAISAMNDLVLQGAKPDEVERFSESDLFWATKKNIPMINRNPRKGQIYQFEFGKNFIPEMSYEHRGLVIGNSGKLLYVLPICSYNASYAEHRDAYHPIHNPGSKSNFFLLQSTEFPFLHHDSVLKMNDIRTVSFSRIKYIQQGAEISQHSDTYKAIEKIVLKKYFPTFAYQFEALTVSNEQLEERCRLLEAELKRLEGENKKPSQQEASGSDNKNALPCG